MWEVIVQNPKPKPKTCPNPKTEFQFLWFLNGGVSGSLTLRKMSIIEMRKFEFEGKVQYWGWQSRELRILIFPICHSRKSGIVKI